MEQEQLRKINSDLGMASQMVFGKIDRVIASVPDGEKVLGIFKAQNNFYSFEISADNKISYSRLQFRRSRTDSYRTDGVLAKKRCKVGDPCGSSCIPKGTVCHLGLPTAGQAKVAAVRAAYKASSKLVRTATKAAVVAGVAAIGAYVAQKAQDPQTQQKVSQALKSLNVPSDTQKKIQGFVSDVKTKVSPNSQSNASVNPRKLTPVESAKLKVKLAVDEYVQAWKHAPAQTAMQHLSVGVLLVSAEQIGEQLGYIPRGTLENSLNASAVKSKVGAGVNAIKSRFKKKQGFKVNSRTTSYGG